MDSDFFAMPTGHAAPSLVTKQRLGGIEVEQGWETEPVHGPLGMCVHTALAKCAHSAHTQTDLRVHKTHTVRVYTTHPIELATLEGRARNKYG